MPSHLLMNSSGDTVVLRCNNQPSDQEAIAEYYRTSRAKDPKSALERAVRAFVAAEVEPQIAAEVKRRVAKTQEELTKQLDELKKLWKESAAEKERFYDLCTGLDGLMTEDEYKLIRGCLHPDRVEDELKPKFGKAFHIFSRLEKSVNWDRPAEQRKQRG